MTTVIFDTRTEEAKKMIEFLKTTRYAKVVEKTPVSDSVEKSLQELQQLKVGKLKGKPVQELLDEL